MSKVLYVVTLETQHHDFITRAHDTYVRGKNAATDNFEI